MPQFYHHLEHMDLIILGLSTSTTKTSIRLQLGVSIICLVWREFTKHSRSISLVYFRFLLCVCACIYTLLPRLSFPPVLANHVPWLWLPIMCPDSVLLWHVHLLAHLLLYHVYLRVYWYTHIRVMYYIDPGLSYLCNLAAQLYTCIGVCVNMQWLGTICVHRSLDPLILMYIYTFI